MSNMNLVFFLIAMFIPWFMGYVIIKLFLKKRYGYQFLAIGSGYLLGWFVATLLLRLYDFIERPFDITEIVVIECIVTLLLILLEIRRSEFSEIVIQPSSSSKLTYLLFFLVTILVIYRWGLTVIDLVSKPTFPWDGWWSWSAKAKIFYHFLSIPPLSEGYVPFWAFPSDDMMPINGVRHPYFISLIQTYVGLAWGQWHDGITNLPWLGLSIAILFTTFGCLRYLGAGLFPSILTGYAAISLPILDVHSSLGSYADVWVGLSFLISVSFLVIMLFYNDWRLFILVIIFSLIGYAAKHTALTFSVVLIAIILWRFVGGYVFSILFTVIIVIACLSREWLNLEANKILGWLLSSKVRKNFIDYNPVEKEVLHQWLILDNWHYLFIFSLLSFFIFTLNKKNYKGSSFILLLVAGGASFSVMLLLTFLTHKMSGDLFVGYFNRVSLYFSFVFLFIPVAIYQLTRKELGK